MAVVVVVVVVTKVVVVVVAALVVRVATVIARSVKVTEMVKIFTISF